MGSCSNTEAKSSTSQKSADRTKDVGSKTLDVDLDRIEKESAQTPAKSAAAQTSAAPHSPADQAAVTKWLTEQKMAKWHDQIVNELSVNCLADLSLLTEQQLEAIGMSRFKARQFFEGVAWLNPTPELLSLDPTRAWELVLKHEQHCENVDSDQFTNPPPKADGMVRFVAISDTHSLIDTRGNQHPAPVIPDGDVLIHAGDFSYFGLPHEVESFNSWIGGLPHATKLVIAGKS